MLLSFSLFGNVDDGVGGENRVDRGDGKRCRGIWASVQVFDYSLGKVVAGNPIVDVVKQVFECVNHPRYFGLVDFCRGCLSWDLFLLFFFSIVGASSTGGTRSRRGALTLPQRWPHA